jgi:hypothetical protein
MKATRRVMLVVGIVVCAMPAATAAARGLHVTLAVPAQATAGNPISVGYTSVGLPRHAKLVVQRQMGTARVWKTVAVLTPKRLARADLPALPLGRYHVRIAVLSGRQVIPDPAANLNVYGTVSLATLCNNSSVTVNQNYPCAAGNTSTQVGGNVFSYVAYGGSYGDSYPAFHDSIDFPATSCRSISLVFGLPNDNASPGDSAYLEVVTATMDPQPAGAAYGSLGVLNAALDGRPWDIDNSSTNGEDPVAVNGTASCDSATGY